MPLLQRLSEPTAKVVSGTVVDEAGNPVPNATVAFHSEADRYESRYWTRATTDDMGIFVVSGIADTEDSVQVTAEGYARLGARRVDFVAGPSQPMRIVLTRGGTLMGTVTDDQGAPRAGVKVLATMSGNSALRFREETRTDVSGRYEFTALPVGSLAVSLRSAEGQATERKEVTVEAGHTQEVNFGN